MNTLIETICQTMKETAACGEPKCGLTSGQAIADVNGRGRGQVGMTRREDGTDQEQEKDGVMDSRGVPISGKMKCFHGSCAVPVSVITVTVHCASLFLASGAVVLVTCASVTLFAASRFLKMDLFKAACYS